MWICENCGHELSAMLGDNEVPEHCECGGEIKEREEKKPWERQIADFINKKSADIEDPLRRFKFFKLLAQLAKHEALHNLEPFLPNEGRDPVINMEIAVGEMVDYLGETDDETHTN